MQQTFHSRLVTQGRNNAEEFFKNVYSLPMRAESSNTIDTSEERERGRGGSEREREREMEKITERERPIERQRERETHTHTEGGWVCVKERWRGKEKERD